MVGCEKSPGKLDLLGAISKGPIRMLQIFLRCGSQIIMLHGYLPILGMCPPSVLWDPPSQLPFLLTTKHFLHALLISENYCLESRHFPPKILVKKNIFVLSEKSSYVIFPGFYLSKSRFTEELGSGTNNTWWEGEKGDVCNEVKHWG